MDMAGTALRRGPRAGTRSLSAVSDSASGSLAFTEVPAGRGLGRPCFPRRTSRASPLRIRSAARHVGVRRLPERAGRGPRMSGQAETSTGPRRIRRRNMYHTASNSGGESAWRSGVAAPG